MGDRRSFPPSVVVAVKALACELPSRLGVPFARLHVPDIRALAVEQGLVARISNTTIWRWLVKDAIRPWQSRSWLFPRDPKFEQKAGVVLDLYQRVFEGRALQSDEFVLCADEKTSIQARIRRHPTQAPACNRPMRVEHEYVRGGSLQYLAALDVHRARVFGRCEQRTGLVPFGRLVTQVMTQEPYRSAHRVFWIVDNGTSHRGPTSVRRLESSWLNLRLIHLPVHASWLSQVEIYFSVLQRKVLTPNDVSSLDEVRTRIKKLEERFNHLATPFDWKYTRLDLARLMQRLDRPVTLAA